MIKKIKGDITKIEADVIVNAANTELRHGGGVALAIAKAAGDELKKDCETIGFCPLGQFVITSPGYLQAQKVIHIPTIDYIKGVKRISYEDLAKVWKKVLEYCQRTGYKRIATEAENFKDLEVIIVEY